MNAQEDIAIIGDEQTPTEIVNLEGELRGISLYVWVISIAIIGISAFLSATKSTTKKSK